MTSRRPPFRSPSARAASSVAVFLAAFCTVALLGAPGSLSAQDASTEAVDTQAPPPAGRVEAILTDLSRIRARIDEVERNRAGATGAEAAFYDFQRRQRWREHHTRLLDLDAAIDDVGLDALDSASVTLARTALDDELLAGRAWLDEVRGDALDQLQVISDAPPEALVEAEIELSTLNAGIDELMQAIAEDYDFAPTLGMDLSSASMAHDSAMVDRAGLVSALLEHGQSRVRELRGWLGKPGIDTVAVDFRIAAAQERIEGAAASLEAMAGLLERRGIDASHYRRLVLTASGSITTEVLDTRVLGGLLAEWGAAATTWMRENGGAIVLRIGLIALVLLLSGRLAGVMRVGMRRAVARVGPSSLVRNLVISGAGKVVWLVAFFVILSILGVDLGPMLAGLGIVGFVVGFALQETLANFASGLMIMVYRPFDVGDFVTISGVTGKVKDLTLVSTVIQTLDNKRIIVPNGKVWGDVINNATAEHVRRVDLVFGISYGDDVDEARSVLEDILTGDDRVLADPPPMVRVESLGDSSVNLLCRPWCRTEDYWELYWDLTRAVKKRFDEEGITFPFPQRTVHVQGQSAPAP